MNVDIRKFPYPYKCAFSISSDIDNASSLEFFVQFMDFLNSERQTIYGSGLGLEVGFGDVIQKPNVENIFQGEEAEKMRKLLDALESLDDVQKVYTNALISTKG